MRAKEGELTDTAGWGQAVNFIHFARIITGTSSVGAVSIRRA